MPLALDEGDAVAMHAIADFIRIAMFCLTLDSRNGTLRLSVRFASVAASILRVRPLAPLLALQELRVLPASIELVDAALPQSMGLSAVRRGAHLDEVVPVALRKAYRLVGQHPVSDARKLPVDDGPRAQADLADHFDRFKRAGPEQAFDASGIFGDWLISTMINVRSFNPRIGFF